MQKSGKERERLKLKMMLVPHNIEEDQKRFEKLFTLEECQIIRPIIRKVLEVELAGLANSTVTRKNFEFQDRISCESILTCACVRLQSCLDSLTVKKHASMN